MVNLLSAYLKDAQSANYHNTVHGLVRTSKDMMDGKLVSFPIALHGNDCTRNAAVLPNADTTSLSYYESITGRVEVHDRLDGNHPRFKTLLNYIYWCNPAKISVADDLLIDKISRLEWTRHEKLRMNDSELRIDAVQCMSIETDPLKVFGKYNYRTSQFMFENEPYKCFSIQMQVIFIAKCPDITLEPLC